MPGISEALLVYGPLGVMTLIGILVSGKLFRILSAERKAHTEKIETLTKDYAAEVKKLNEDHQKELAEAHRRHSEKAEEWMKGYHDLANSLNSAFEGLLRRIRRED
jgi:Skp family chaperone for outer membrane proteins